MVCGLAVRERPMSLSALLRNRHSSHKSGCCWSQQRKGSAVLAYRIWTNGRGVVVGIDKASFLKGCGLKDTQNHMTLDEVNE